MTTGLVMGTVMTQTIFWIVTMMVETAVALTSTRNSAQNVFVLILTPLQHQLQEAQLGVQQQLEDATWDGLVIIIVMISITTWTAAMMVETVVTVVVVLLILNGAQFAHALIQMEVGVEHLAHLLQQQLLTQVVMHQH